MEHDVLKLINQKDDLQLTIKCHLLVESYLIKLIENALIEPSHFQIDKLSFPQKIGLSIALGAITSDFKGLFLKINKLRNKFAHDLETQISDKDIQELHLLLSSSFKDGLIQTPFSEKDNIGKLGGIFMCMFAYLQESYEYQLKNA